MQKQKKTLAHPEPSSKSKTKNHAGGGPSGAGSAAAWSQQNFKELYPEEPAMTTSSTFFTINLNYKGNVIKVKVPTGVANSALPYIFHKEIYKFLLNIKDKNPLLKTAQVVGFETVDSNLLLDYQVSIGKGVLTAKASFNCLEFVPEGRLKKYKIYKCLAIGGFSKVYLVRSLRDGTFYAMKVMLKKFISNTQKQSIIQNEKNISSQLNHPFIVRLNHAFETSNFVCLVLDYCPGGELFYYLKQVKRMSQEDARFYFIEILYGLLYLHQQKIIYRDLKPENLLINHDGHIKIADFGLSKQNMKEKQMTYSFCGSTQYMPPQMILREGHSFGVDFYTLGALLYELVTGLPPFYSKDEQQIKESIINEDLSFPDHVMLSSQIKNLLTGLLHKNQKMRIGSMRGLKQILFHPWVGKMNSQSILSKQLEPPYIPPIDEFNFDQNELGEDEQQFSRALMNEHLIPSNKETLVYKDFQFLNQRCLRPEIKMIYDKYGMVDEQSRRHNQRSGGDADTASCQRDRDGKKRVFKKCNSLKNLKNRNTCDEIEKFRMKRQASSPYLRSASINNLSHPKKTKPVHTNLNPAHASPEKILKMLQNRSKQSLPRSLSKKNLKTKNIYTIASANTAHGHGHGHGQGHTGDKSQNTLYSKTLKKKSTCGSGQGKENMTDPQLIQNWNKGSQGSGSGCGSSGNGFLKKKKLVYNYQN